jgi:hypothetical protein
MIRAARSYIAALLASRRFGEAARLRDKGRKSEALSVGREALVLLAQPHVIRSNPAEASALISATVLVEGLASELNQSGASLRDVDESLNSIRALNRTSPVYAEWASFLAWRLEQRRAGAV